MASVAAMSRHGQESFNAAVTDYSPASTPFSPETKDGKLDMIPNPNFSFPKRHVAPPLKRPETNSDWTRRPASMHINIPPPNVPTSHRRAMSGLPSFSFNAADSSGLSEGPQASTTASENVAPPPSRRGHRRGVSELVGGDSRLGLSNAVSTSPTKTTTPPMPIPPAGPPAGRRGHTHRRSQAISSHDLSSIMQPPSEPQPRLSSSLPNTPGDILPERPALERADSTPDVKVHPPPETEGEDVDANRPPSRLRVGFADDVEYIPRPLSTISSDSSSTARGHSVNNSMSSMLSMSNPNPPSSRTPHSTLSSTSEDEPKPRARASLEVSKRIEKEGEWLKSRSSNSLRRPVSESAMAPKTTQFVLPEPPVRSPNEERRQHKRKHSLGESLGFDRRKSEPMIGMSVGPDSRLSAVSLDEPSQETPCGPECQVHKSSRKRFRDWVDSKISRKSKEAHKPVPDSSSTVSLQSERTEEGPVPGMVPRSEAPVAETDLDAVLSSQDTAIETQPRPQSQPRIDVSAPSPTSLQSSVRSHDADDSSPILDLDAALGPFKTPEIGGSQKQRRELHSSRLTKDFTGPGGHYHRRTESAPTLTAFDSARAGTPSQSSMADVFEEEEEEDEEDIDGVSELAVKSASPQSQKHDADSIGISVVDSSNTAPDNSLDWGVDDVGRVPRGEFEPDRPMSSYSNAPSRLSMPIGDGRRSSVIEDTIFEEPSPSEPVAVVHAHEEPRTSSLTKSSDSSDTPTVLGPQPNPLPALEEPRRLTPGTDTYSTSNCSSPDFGARRPSTDTSRINTAASSINDERRTVSSYMTSEPAVEARRTSVDDVPSLTSSRSTMLSTMHANTSRRDFSGSAHSSSSAGAAVDRTPSASYQHLSPAPTAPDAAAERQRKRGSIQSLSQLMGHSFGPKSRDGSGGGDDGARPFGGSSGLRGMDGRPYTAAEGSTTTLKAPKKREHRLKKLMFWRSKATGRQVGNQT